MGKFGGKKSKVWRILNETLRKQGVRIWNGLNYFTLKTASATSAETMGRTSTNNATQSISSITWW